LKSYKIIESETNNVESRGWKTIVEIESWTWKIVRQRKESNFRRNWTKWNHCRTKKKIFILIMHSDAMVSEKQFQIETKEEWLTKTKKKLFGMCKKLMKR